MSRKVTITDEQAERIMSAKSISDKVAAYESVEKELGIYIKLGKYYDSKTNLDVTVIPYNKPRPQLTLF
ncbi:hypothetical protein ACLCDV_08155 [Sphingobacterium sp. Lzh-3]|uniref:hypothetical protein n=1 Tax=Sphingobacterium sp. Lzh-3 TaxID=3382150 RepID=UPI00398C906D